MHVQKFISIQSTQLWRVVFECLANALPVYKNCPHRPPVAGPENIECSAAITLLVISLEAHVNRLMYFEPQNLNTSLSLNKKLKKYLPDQKHELLLDHMDEVAVCRDSVTHALVWEEERKSDANWSIVGQAWNLAAITAPRPKLKRCLDFNREQIRSRLLAINVVPTNVDVVDVSKALIVVCRIMRELEYKYGNSKAWVGPFPSAEHLVATFMRQRTDDSLEVWIAGLLRQLHPYHLQEVLDCLEVRSVTVDGEIEFNRLSRYR
jgi:hypothetical protein